MKSFRRVFSSSLLLMALASGHPIWAQTILQGKVTDPQKNGISARLSLYAPGTLTPLTATTSAGGDYKFEGLREGQYTVEVEATDFRRVTRVVKVGTTAATENASTSWSARRSCVDATPACRSASPAIPSVRW